MTEDFFLSKVLWEHRSIQKKIRTKKKQFHSLLGQTRAKNKSCWKLDIGYLKKVLHNWILDTLYLSASHPKFFLPKSNSCGFAIHPKFKIITKWLIYRLNTRKVLLWGWNSGSELPMGRRSLLRKGFGIF